jgi:hypothetical protein
MARADQLLDLVKAARSGDEKALRRSVEAIAAEERNKQHHILAENLLDVLNVMLANQISPTTYIRRLLKSDSPTSSFKRKSSSPSMD